MNIIASPRRGTNPAPSMAERPRGTAPARLGGRPGVSRTVIDELTAFAAVEETRRAVPVELGPDPLSTEPLVLKDYADVLRGAWAQHTRLCQRADNARSALVRRHLDAVRLPALRASQDLDTAIDMASLDAEYVRLAFDAIGDGDRGVFDEVAAAWIAAGAEKTGSEVTR